MSRVACVNVTGKKTDATVGATALLLPAQNTHTLHDPKRGTEHARAGGVEDGLGVGGLDGGGDVGECVPAPPGVLPVGGECCCSFWLLFRGSVSLVVCYLLSDGHTIHTIC